MNPTTTPKPLPMPQRLDIRRALNTPPPTPDFVLPGLPTGTVGALIAPGATGKTLLLLQMCVALATGTPVLGGALFPGAGEVSPAPAKVVLVVAEETADIMHARLHAAVGELITRLRPGLFGDIPLEDRLAEHLHLYPLAGRFRMLLDGGLLDPREEGLAALRELSRDARLVVIDPLRQFHAGDENDAWVMTHLVQNLQALMSGGKGAILLAHHTNKWSTVNGQGDKAGAARGSASLTDAVRWQLNLSALDEDLAHAHGIRSDELRHHVRVDLAKSNYLPPQAPVVLRRGAGGAFTAVGAAASGKRRSRS